MASDLPERLRRTAVREQHFSLPGDTAQADLVRDLRDAADALESYELAERERLEREAVTPEFQGTPFGGSIDWPLIPWPSDYPDHASYHRAMVGWHKTVTRIQKLNEGDR